MEGRVKALGLAVAFLNPEREHFINTAKEDRETADADLKCQV